VTDVVCAHVGGTFEMFELLCNKELYHAQISFAIFRYEDGVSAGIHYQLSLVSCFAYDVIAGSACRAC
jgi:hypothetical protein